MSEDCFKPGDRVKLINVPKWLIQDLPKEDKAAITSCIGKFANIKEIDKFGYIWLDFNVTYECRNQENLYIKGAPLFCVTKESLELVKD